MDNRSVYVHTRLGAEEREALERLCAYEAMRLSETMRMALREAAKARGLWPTQPTPAEMAVTK